MPEKISPDFLDRIKKKAIEVDRNVKEFREMLNTPPDKHVFSRLLMKGVAHPSMRASNNRLSSADEVKDHLSQAELHQMNLKGLGLKVKHHPDILAGTILASRVNPQTGELEVLVEMPQENLTERIHSSHARSGLWPDLSLTWKTNEKKRIRNDDGSEQIIVERTPCEVSMVMQGKKENTHIDWIVDESEFEKEFGYNPFSENINPDLLFELGDTVIHKSPLNLINNPRQHQKEKHSKQEEEKEEEEEEDEEKDDVKGEVKEEVKDDKIEQLNSVEQTIEPGYEQQLSSEIVQQLLGVKPGAEEGFGSEHPDKGKQMDLFAAVSGALVPPPVHVSDIISVCTGDEEFHRLFRTVPVKNKYTVEKKPSTMSVDQKTTETTPAVETTTTPATEKPIMSDTDVLRSIHANADAQGKSVLDNLMYAVVNKPVGQGHGHGHGQGQGQKEDIKEREKKEDADTDDAAADIDVSAYQKGMNETNVGQKRKAEMDPEVERKLAKLKKMEENERKELENIVQSLADTYANIGAGLGAGKKEDLITSHRDHFQSLLPDYHASPERMMGVRNALNVLSVNGQRLHDFVQGTSSAPVQDNKPDLFEQALQSVSGIPFQRSAPEPMSQGITLQQAASGLSVNGAQFHGKNIPTQGKSYTSSYKSDSNGVSFQEVHAFKSKEDRKVLMQKAKQMMGRVTSYKN